MKYIIDGSSKKDSLIRVKWRVNKTDEWVYIGTFNSFDEAFVCVELHKIGLENNVKDR